MSWTLLVALVLCLGIMLLASISRRRELERMSVVMHDRARAKSSGSDEAKLQYPVIDLSRCLGCATCVAVCPEEGVLEIVHGQAVVVNGSHCEGISACERECPVGAITVTISSLKTRDDIPVLTNELEAIETPGLFIAGELTAHALIKSAIEQGARVGEEVAARIASEVHEPGLEEAPLDLCVVGAGPAGLACSLVAKREGLDFVTIDRELVLGGTVAKYPRLKLVMTQPVEMPIYGRFKQTSYVKEELIDLWQGIADEQELPIQGGVSFEGLEREADGLFRVNTDAGVRRARNVCLALGRRGDPRKLGVPGEDLPKLTYGLMDAAAYESSQILIVGGGDTAAEAALALSAQHGNRVTVSYRRSAFFRLKARNERLLLEAEAQGRVELLFDSQVIQVLPDAVELRVTREGVEESVLLPNEFVFVLSGGVPPFEMLAQSGVSFDPSLRPDPPSIVERGTGITQAIAVAFALALSTLIWSLWHSDYYWLEIGQRAVHLKHDLLRPSKGVGLWLGVAAAFFVLVNLAYLLRRSPSVNFRWGSLQKWMTSHVATGVLALLCALLHAAMSPRDTAGGHAFISLLVLLVTGCIGRYFYAFVPRATNGRELEFEEVKSSLGRLAEEFDQGYYKFRELVRSEIDGLVQSSQWKTTLSGRILGVLSGQRRLKRTLKSLEEQGERDGVPRHLILETLHLARRAHKSASTLAHYEDLRALIGTWRYLHRWGALIMVLLLGVHIFLALVYSEGT